MVFTIDLSTYQIYNHNFFSFFYSCLHALIYDPFNFTIILVFIHILLHFSHWNFTRIAQNYSSFCTIYIQ